MDGLLASGGSAVTSGVRGGGRRAAANVGAGMWGGARARARERAGWPERRSWNGGRSWRGLGRTEEELIWRHDDGKRLLVTGMV